MPKGELTEGARKQAVFFKPFQPVQDQLTVNDRFPPPNNFKRAYSDSFSVFLRKLNLLPKNSPIKLYNGQVSNRQVHEAVVNLPIGKKDLHQCADAIMHIRSLYFYEKKQFDSIKFRFTNGFLFDYSTWIRGYRIQIKGNHVNWIKTQEAKNDLHTFYAYLEVLYTYAGTASLSKELKMTNPSNIKPGDVLITPGFPGHAVLVIDVAQNDRGQKLILIGQSFMPAQQFHILKPQLGSNQQSPWFHWPENGSFITPEWTFNVNNLMTW